jgi:group I intron endonuclease
MQGIYKITNKLNKRYYVGSSVDIQERLNTHLWALKNNRHENPKLQHSWNKHGEHSFTTETVEEFVGTYNDLLLLEDTYLEKLPKNTFNIRKSSLKKNPYDEAIRKKISDGVKLHWKLNGKSHSESLRKYRQDKYYKKKMKESCKNAWKNNGSRRQLASEQKVGINNPSADKTIYSFSHINGETFVGVKCNFRKIHPELNLVGLKKLIDKKWKQYKGWRVTSQSTG